MDIKEGTIGAEGKYDVEIVDGQVVAKASFKGAGYSTKADFQLDIVYILEQVKAKIPGSIDDIAISILQNALKSQTASHEKV